MSHASPSFDRIVLAGDIGGTNTTLALVGIRNGHHGQKQYELLQRVALASRELPGLPHGVSLARRRFDAALWRHVDAGCLCAAGAIKNNYGKLTNLPWEVDGDQLSADLGMPVALINDFSGICYGIPILFRQSPQQFSAIPRSGGTVPPAEGSVMAVVGAGTGLGVGFLTTLPDGSVIAHPSEGGHCDFAPFDRQSAALRHFVAARSEVTPDTECFLSGPGIGNIFDYLLSDRSSPHSTVVRRILHQPLAQRAPLIAEAVDDDPLCRRTMELFVRIYARFASSVALHFFATGGLFLAGGIAAKNIRLLLEDDLFIQTFEQNCHDVMRRLLRRVPVHVVRDYSVSLYGAAYAAVCLNRHNYTSEEQIV